MVDGAGVDVAVGSEESSVQRKSYCSRYVRQTQVLAMKNVLLHRRNLVATLSQFGVGIFSILAFAITIAGLNTLYGMFGELSILRETPVTQPSSIICDPEYARGPSGSCFSFVVIGDTPQDEVLGQKIAEIVYAGLDQPPEQDQPSGWRMFKNASTFKTWTLDNPNTTRVGVQMDWSGQF